MQKSFCDIRRRSTSRPVPEQKPDCRKRLNIRPAGTGYPIHYYSVSSGSQEKISGGRPGECPTPNLFLERRIESGLVFVIHIPPSGHLLLVAVHSGTIVHNSIQYTQVTDKLAIAPALSDYVWNTKIAVRCANPQFR